MQPIVTLTLNPALDLSTSTDAVVPTEKLRCIAPQFDPGGGGINVARAIRALGGQALAVFPAGGPTGAVLQTLLAEEGVACQPIHIAGRTRENLAVDERRSGQQFRFVMPGPALQAEELDACLSALAGIRPQPAYVVASGSLPPGCPDDFYAEIIDWAATNGIRIVLDTSGAALNVILGKKVFLVKPSRAELEHLTGSIFTDRSSITAAARDLVAQQCAEIVVVSLGAEGAILASEKMTGFLPAPHVKVCSTVGAGDSMVAGLVLAIAQGQPLEKALQLGIVAGAAATLRPGTGLCRREDVVRLLGEDWLAD